MVKLFPDGEGARVYSLVYPDAPTREAATGFTAADIGRVALQQDNNTYWVLLDVTPTWQQMDSVTDTSALVDGDIPQKQGTDTLVPSKGRIVNNKTQFDTTIEVPAASLDIGTVMRLSEGGQELIVVDLINEVMSFSVNSVFESSAGSSIPTYVNYGIGAPFIIQPDDSFSLTANPTIVQNTTVVPPPNEFGLTDMVELRTSAPMTNFRVKVTDVATGFPLQYIPSRAAFEGREPGLDIGAGSNFFYFTQQGTNTANTFYLGWSPFVVIDNQLLEFEFVADTMALLGDNIGFPFIDTEAHVGGRVKLLTMDRSQFYAFVNDNAVVNGAITNGVFADQEFGTLTAGSQNKDFILNDASTGLIEYTGAEPFQGMLQFSYVGDSSGGPLPFRYKWQINDGGGWADLLDPIEVVIEVGSSADTASAMVPISLQSGNLLRPQVTRDAGSSDLTTVFAAISVR